MEKITLQEFLSLPDHERKEVLSKEGKFIKEKVERDRKKEVYALGTFIVEVEEKV